MPNPNIHATTGPPRLVVSDEPATIPPPATAAHVGDDRYVFVKFHARGGMGEVWLCQDRQLGREVALKRLSCDEQLARQRFLAEAQVTGQLEHPGIIPIHDVGQDENGRPFYIMKFVRGGSLKEAIQDYHDNRPTGTPRAVKWRRLLEVFVDLCHTVAYAHSRGVLHRDLKPDNVMLGAYGETIVLDWGLAKIRGQDIPTPALPASVRTSGAQTQAGSIIGSPLYMPPEMAAGQTAEVDERADIYLLGATLYEILTGKTPREGKSFDELLSMARAAAVVSPRQRRREIPKALNAVCLKAMATRKEDRYTSAMDLAQDVERYLAGEPVSAWRESFIARTWRWARRHRLALQRTAAAVIVIVGLIILRGAIRQAEILRAREQARSQIQAFDNLSEEARYFAASSDPTAEHAPYFDPAKARVDWNAALNIASAWGSTLQNLPLPDQRPALRAQLYEILLLMVQDTCQSRQGLDAVPSLLDRARQLMPLPSRGYYLLQARYLRLMNDPDGAARQEALAGNPTTPAIAFDSFLLGEDFRTRSADEPAAASSSTISSRRLADLTQAIHFYRQAIQQDPRHFWSHFQLGRCYMSIGDFSDAAEALSSCIALRPDAPWGYSARGMALGLLHRFDEAHADLQRAVELDPDFRPAWLNLGVVYWLQHDTKDAMASLNRALAPPEDRALAEAQYYRAQIYVEQNQYTLALADLNRAVSERQQFYPAYLLRARVELMQGAQAAGLKDINLLLAHDAGPDYDPESGPGLGQRGQLLRRIAAELPKEARRATLRLASQDLQSAIQNGGESGQVYHDLGAVQDALGEDGAAADSYTRALQLAPHDVPTFLDRGWLTQRLGRNDEARTDFTSAIAIDPSNAEAHTGLGFVAACQGTASEAQEQAAQALVTGGNDYLILHNVACIYAELSQTDPPHGVEHQATAVATLARAISIWRDHRTGPDEIQLIRQENLFSTTLKDAPGFQEILNGGPN
ncbi:MAG TPA: tetratricopeptide repeat protein [Tepidisphaeraceae bacterium]|nr:tetratricopeptide repeat protein [Tepidisphaeraceae bacterium]